jgi:hypothetical protein
MVVEINEAPALLARLDDARRRVNALIARMAMAENAYDELK